MYNDIRLTYESLPHLFSQYHFDSSITTLVRIGGKDGGTSKTYGGNCLVCLPIP